MGGKPRRPNISEKAQLTDLFKRRMAELLTNQTSIDFEADLAVQSAAIAVFDNFVSDRRDLVT